MVPNHCTALLIARGVVSSLIGFPSNMRSLKKFISCVCKLRIVDVSISGTGGELIAVASFPPTSEADVATFVAPPIVAVTDERAILEIKFRRCKKLRRVAVADLLVLLVRSAFTIVEPNRSVKYKRCNKH